MRRIALLSLAALLLPLPTYAATVNLLAAADASIQGGETINALDPQSFDTATDQFGFAQVTVEPITGEGNSSANAHFDYAPGTLHASANATKNAGTTPSTHFATANAGQTETYTADGDGSVKVTFKYTGRVGVLTDLTDPERFSRMFAGLDIEAPGHFESSFFDSALHPDPLFGLTSGFFEDEFVAMIDLFDGDTLRVAPYIGASAGVQALVPAFFDAGTEINGFLTVEATGTVLTGTDGTLIPTTPVPIPAGGLLLLTPLGAMLIARRRRG